MVISPEITTARGPPARFAGHAAARILGQDRVEDHVGNLVGNLVGMAFDGSEKRVFFGRGSSKQNPQNQPVAVVLTGGFETGDSNYYFWPGTCQRAPHALQVVRINSAESPQL